MKLFLFLISLFFTMLIFCQTPKNIDIWKMKEWGKFKSNEYTLEFPSIWTIDTTGRMGTNLIFISPYESDDDLFNENFNLVISKNEENLSLNDYTDASIKRIKEVLEKFELIETSKRIKNNFEYQYVFFKGKQDFFNLIFIQHYYIIDNKNYVLTFTSEQSKIDLHKINGEKILNSFKLL
jgi:hypothetical protein